VERRRPGVARSRHQLALELAWSRSRGRDCLRVRGWSDGQLAELQRLSADALARRVAVYPSGLGGAVAAPLPSMAGELEIERDGVCFTPRFPFLAGTTYVVRVGERSWTLRRPDQETAVPRAGVVEIYPTAETLPLNQLKLYVLFSGAMSEGSATRAGSLRRADGGGRIEGALLPMEPELWDRDRTRLTLLLDPGRIKRGLVGHDQAGYPLTEGVAVVVGVEGSFRDAAGRPLLAAAERRYHIGAPVRAKVDPGAWQITPPPLASRERLTVDFDRPFDRALLEHSLTVATDDGTEIPGRAEIAHGERRWSFAPDRPWRPGAHELIVDALLEDLAGNSLARVFDRDLTRLTDDPLDIRQATVTFRCC
jgi:hypothetical protein